MSEDKTNGTMVPVSDAMYDDAQVYLDEMRKEVQMSFRASELETKRNYVALTREEEDFLVQWERRRAEIRERVARREAEERASALTVGQLIAHLSTLDPSLPVKVMEGGYDSGEEWASVDDVEVTEDGYVSIGR